MEWVVTTGKTVDEAKEAALDQLGVDADEAEFEIVEEPKTGLFGRLRSEAQVRARVRPTQPRPKVERRDRRRRGKGEGEGETRSPRPAATDGGPREEGAAASSGGNGRARSSSRSTSSTTEREPSSRPPRHTRGPRSFSEEISNMTEQKTVIVDFVQGLVDSFGVSGQLETSSTDEEIAINIAGADLGLLIGPRGATLQSIQDLSRAVLQRHFPDDRHARVRIDVGGYRERRKAALERFVHSIADEVRDTGRQKALEPMSSADRKVVHDTANDLDGVHTISEGFEPNRRVVILPGDAD